MCSNPLPGNLQVALRHSSTTATCVSASLNLKNELRYMLVEGIVFFCVYTFFLFHVL